VTPETLGEMGAPHRALAPRRAKRRGLLARLAALFRRPAPTLYQRCLAVHIGAAAPRSALR
jgi:hypothetical protein